MPSITLSTTQSGRWRLVTAGVTAVVVATAGLAAAAPASADVAQQIRDTQRRLDSLDRQAEAAAERFNAGRIALAGAQQRASVAQATLAREDRGVAALSRQASVFAAQVYMTGPAGQGIAIISGSNPEQVLGQLGVLDRISRRQSDVMVGLATARGRQAGAATDARAALQQMQATVASLQRDKRTVEIAGAQAQRLLVELQAEQAQIVRAARDAAARRAAQVRAVAMARQATAASASLASFRAQPTAVEQPVAATAPSAAGGGAARTAVRLAMQQLGKSYVWGASGPDHFDCSGLTMFSYAAAGISLSHFTGAQWNEGRHVSRGELRPGDLVFFEASLGHMGMYIGNGQFIHAPHTGDVVKISSLSGYYANEYAGAVRVAG